MSQLYSFSRQSSNSQDLLIQETNHSFDHEAQIQVIDLDNNQIFDEHDRYYFKSSQGLSFELNTEQGLRLLNVFSDPRSLRRHQQFLKTFHEDLDLNLLPLSTLINNFEQLQDLNSYQRELGIWKEANFWSPSGAIAYQALTGNQTFRPNENSAYTSLLTGFSGMFNAFNSTLLVHRMLLRTALFVTLFIVGSKTIHPLFMWHMYMSNYINMNVGSLYEGSLLRERIKNIEQSTSSLSSVRERLQANLQMGLARLTLAEDHTYWAITWPFAVLVGGFADADFRKIWPAPWRLPNTHILKNYFSSQINSSFRFIRRGLPQCFLAGLAFYGIYQLSLNWNSIFGGAPAQTLTGKTMALSTTVPIGIFILDLFENGRNLPWGLKNWISLHSHVAGKIALAIGAVLALGSITGEALGYFNEQHTPFSRLQELFVSH